MTGGTGVGGGGSTSAGTGTGRRKRGRLSDMDDSAGPDDTFAAAGGRGDLLVDDEFENDGGE